jgi:short-subunit dehydrogenase
MQLDGKTIILTGAASGIGLALLEELSAFSGKLLAVDRNAQGLGEARTQGRMQVIPHACDLGQPNAVDEIFERALGEMGGVDLFIANAGFAYYEKIESPDWEHIERLYRVNVFAPLYAAEKMRKLNSGRPYKTVITASAMSFLGIPGYAVYSSSKAALHRFADAYRFELDDPRSLALVYPIGTRTSFFGAASPQPAPIPWPSQPPGQVARAIVAGIQRDRVSIYPSLLFRIFLAIPFLPRLEQWIEARRLKKWLETQGMQK